MSCVLGLDAGGSTTRAWVENPEGEIIFKGQSGPANWTSTPLFRLRQSLERALDGVPQVDAVCGCFAGLLSPKQGQDAVDLLKDLTQAERVEARPDYHATWAACPEGTTALVIAGTGSVVVSESKEKQLIRSGGGGPLFGDFGSSFGFVRQTIQSAIRQGQPLPAEVLDEAQQLFRTESLESLLVQLYQSPSPAAATARLAKSVIAAASKGAPLAKEAIQAELLALSEVLIRHLKEWHNQDVPWRVALAGGMWKNAGWLLRTFEDHCVRLTSASRESTGWALFPLNKAPVTGAIRLAKRLLA